VASILRAILLRVLEDEHTMLIFSQRYVYLFFTYNTNPERYYLVRSPLFKLYRDN
jgi:hypothetical protein